MDWVFGRRSILARVVRLHRSLWTDLSRSILESGVRATRKWSAQRMDVHPATSYWNAFFRVTRKYKMTRTITIPAIMPSLIIGSTDCIVASEVLVACGALGSDHRAIINSVILRVICASRFAGISARIAALISE